MDLSNCSLCAEDIGTTEIIKCSGICGGKFHYSCLSKENKNYKKTMVELLNKIDNLQWYCDSCIPHSLNTVVSKFTVGANYFDEIKSLLNSFISLTNPPVQLNLASTPIASSNSYDQIEINAQPNDTQISTQAINNDVTTAQTVSGIESQEEMEIDIQTNRNKRARSLSPERSTNVDNVDILHNMSSAPVLNSSPLENLVLGANSDSTEKVSLDELVVQDKDKNAPGKLRSIYLTKFSPNAQNEDIIEHLKKFDVISDVLDKISCTRLVNRNVKSNKLTFVSFKIDVPEDNFDILMKTDFWPCGVTAKEFEHRTPQKRIKHQSPIANQHHSTQTNRNKFNRKNFNKTLSGSKNSNFQFNETQRNRHQNMASQNQTTCCQQQCAPQRKFRHANHDRQSQPQMRFNPFSINRRI